MRRLPAGSERGYVLIDIVAAFAVVALIAGLCVPRLPLGSNGVSVDAMSTDIVALLRDARSMSIADATSQSVHYDPLDRILTGAKRSILISPDMAFSFRSGPLCAGVLIVFRPDGTNCGSILHLGRGTRFVEIRVNWIDGAIAMQART